MNVNRFFLEIKKYKIGNFSLVLADLMEHHVLGFE